jgi:hypothetical protein
MDTIQFSCNVINDSLFDDLALEFWLDNTKFFDDFISPGITKIEYEFPEEENHHVIRMVMKNKTIDHTVIDENNNIIEDAVLEIRNVFFDQLNIDYIFYSNCTYTHDFNGTGKITVDDYYGTLGCNGTVEFQFTTPFYIWLLEHM